MVKVPGSDCFMGHVLKKLLKRTIDLERNIRTYWLRLLFDRIACKMLVIQEQEEDEKKEYSN